MRSISESFSAGITGATITPEAAVYAGGRIVYSGAYRGYGQIVIIDHGGGWTSLVTNLAALAVKVGDRVAIAAPLGRAAAARPAITVELRHRGRAVDMVPLIAAG